MFAGGDMMRLVDSLGEEVGDQNLAAGAWRGGHGEWAF